jgi:hypothetical protein
MRRGKRLEDILDTARAADPACSPEYAKSVLIGDIPLDRDDEGFASLGIAETIQDIHAFFKAAVDEHEQSIAARMLGDKPD